ncbi:multiheme c-type cytochrome [Novipirellula sp. SH528]|uniref:multiheme c-type cytochrome n=1 Tax=Novipirellula sp. SH528 TaxID=3454466 RepID=UPI003FA1446B
MNKQTFFLATFGALLLFLAIGIRFILSESTPATEAMPRSTASPRVSPPVQSDVSAAESDPTFSSSIQRDFGTSGIDGQQSKPLLTLTAAVLGPQSEIGSGFVGSTTCQKCHAEAHKSWHSSYHRTMTQQVNEKTAPDAIINQTVTIDDKTYVFEQNGDHFQVSFPDPLVGNQVRSRRLVLMTGSHHLHVFWYETDVHGTPGQLDIVFLKEEQRWIPRESSFLRPSVHSNVLELGTWNRTCSRCHATHPTEGFNELTEDWDTRVSEFGIACEACHGEGAGHAHKHASDPSVILSLADLDSDHASQLPDRIVNPGNLSKQASADVCGQCHSIFIPDYDVVSQSDYSRNGNPFRPGELLSEVGFSRVVRATPEFRDTETFQRWSSMEELSSGFWSDGTPRIAGREYNGLIESPCFQKGEMTCLSCHTMHPSAERDVNEWRDDQLKPGMRGDLACLQCHQEHEDNIAEHTHHAVQSEGSRCMNCHMPHTTYGLLKTIRSHQISSPSIQASRTSDRPDACSLCHLDKTFGWVSQKLSEWYGQEFDIKEQLEVSQPVSTSVLHLLRGDAAQRVVQVAALGWQPAQQASGTDWMEPFLLLGLNDPYDAVRIVAGRSLQTLPQRRTLESDPLAPARERMEMFNRSIELIDKNAEIQPRPEVLVDENGHFDFPRVRALLEQRNHRPIYLRE